MPSPPYKVGVLIMVIEGGMGSILLDGRLDMGWHRRFWHPPPPLAPPLLLRTHRPPPPALHIKKADSVLTLLMRIGESIHGCTFYPHIFTNTTPPPPFSGPPHRI